MSSPAPRRLIVLGSTGSIGVNTLCVAKHLTSHGHPMRIVGLGAGKGAEKLIEQARQFDVPAVAIADPSQAAAVRAALPRVKVHTGENAALDLVRETDATDLMAAVVGSAGLPATLAAIDKGMNIALANKETLVAAGALVTPLARHRGVQIIPVDSEHSAIFQCLVGQSHHGSVKRIVLTASGGPFRTAEKAAIENASVEQALNHPTWKMGPKITIDSATMMNKALEIIEAHWLFDLPAEKIEVIIHPQSVAHSFVEFADHSVLAQLGSPDMKMPIQYALTYPRRAAGCGSVLDWSTLTKLEFSEPDYERFPALKLAYNVVRAQGTAGAVFNAANEAAVQAFLDRRIRFGRIVELAAEALDAIAIRPVDGLETVLEADRQARTYVADRLNR